MSGGGKNVKIISMISGNKINDISSFDDEAVLFHKSLEKKSEKLGHSFENLADSHKEKIIVDTIEEHQKEAPEFFSQDYIAKKENAEKIILKLSPDEDDERMETLLGLMHEVGIYNTLKTIDDTETYHVKDDFHRFLVQYIKSGQLINLKKKSPVYSGLHMTLFEVSLPEIAPEKKHDEKQKTLEMFLASMEQFYNGMIAVSENSEEKYFSLELALPQEKNKVNIFCAIPDTQKNIFKNHLLATFPDASIKEVYDDYNIFNKNNHVALSEVSFEKFQYLPIKSYKHLQYDPLNIIIKSFSSIQPQEGGAIQILLSPQKDTENFFITEAINKILKGDDIRKVLSSRGNFWFEFRKIFIDIFEKILDLIDANIFDIKNDGKSEKKVKDQQSRDTAVEALKEKNSSRLFKTNIRFIASSDSQEKANMILNELESSFFQFENSNGNKFKFKKISSENLKNKTKDFIFRVFDKKSNMFLNITELTSIFHFPSQHLKAGELLETSSSASSVSEKIMSSTTEIQKKIEKDKEYNENLAIKTQQSEQQVKNYNEGGKNIDNNYREYVEGLDNGSNQNDSYNQYFSKEEMLDYDLSQGKSQIKPEVSQQKVSPNIQEEQQVESNQKNIIEPEQNNNKDFSTDGSSVLLGINSYQGVETPIYLQPNDRLRHMYVVGQTGTGKTTILKNMIIQDIRNGEGCCFIDPHGSDIEDVLAQIPEDRFEDVIYFDPADLERPLGLNMLEYNTDFPEQKTFVINELFSIFKKLYGDVPESMGPAFEQYFRNATALVLEDPESGNTMVEISRVLADEEFRNLKLSKCDNMIIRQFWEKIATQAGGEAALENIVPYITNKFDVFLSNDYLRPIISQEKSSLDFRDIMDNKKILLVNLSKGRLGDLNANMIGMILVGKILMAALSRVDSIDKKLPPFYLYMDEFQNVTTDSISQILSEARKYSLSLTIAHQYIKQIEEKIRNSVFGNVGSMAIFRVGTEDTEILEKQLAPIFSAKDIMNLDNYNAYLKILVDGQPQKPFNVRTMPPEEGNPEVRKYIKNLSAQKYGRPRAEVEFEVQEKFRRLNEIESSSSNNGGADTDFSDFDMEDFMKKMGGGDK